MTHHKSTQNERDCAERRGDDTHWWKAYQVHCAAALATKAQATPSSTAAASRSLTECEPFRPIETKMQRAVSKALGSPQSRSVQIDPTSY